MSRKTYRYTFGWLTLDRAGLRQGLTAFREHHAAGCTILALLFLALLGAPARGQSVNIDFDGGSGVPSEAYAAAGLPGVWNGLTAPPGAPETLVNLEGIPLDATVSQIVGSGVVHIDDPATSGDDQALLDDFVPGLGCVVIGLLFEGLENGNYDVITYAWTPAAPEARSLVYLDVTGGDGQVIGGPWPGSLELGVTHTLHRVTVSEGTLAIYVAAGYFGTSGCINGVQLRFVSNPGDVNCDGVVNAFDIDPFVLALTDPAGYEQLYTDCYIDNADCNGDGEVNAFDIDPFVELLTGN